MNPGGWRKGNKLVLPPREGIRDGDVDQSRESPKKMLLICIIENKKILMLTVRWKLYQLP